MNAISRPEPPPTERTTRHLTMCQRLAEIGMQLAEAAGAKALADLTAPAPASIEAPEQPTRRAAIHPGLLFARLSRAVRQAIALEARIAAGEPARTHHRASLDPRGPLLRQTLRDATADHPCRNELRREADERLDVEFALDPTGQIPVDEILATICEDLGVRLNLSKLSDELIGIQPQPQQAAPLTWLPPPTPQNAGPPSQT